MIKVEASLSKLLFSTVRIEAQLNSGGTSIGTGFFFLFDTGEGSILALVTNKHVIQGAKILTFWLHEATHQNEPKDTSLKLVFHGSGGSDITDWCFYHPGNVDLCAIPASLIIDEAEKLEKKVYIQALGEEELPTDDILNELLPSEDILMFGYPIGLWDEINNLPLIRRGITAFHPAADFRGESLGVVDIAVFPGSSGSPILITNEGSYLTPKGITNGKRLIVLGILFAGPQFSVDGAIKIIDAPTQMTSMINTMIPAHLGFYIKSKELLILKKAIIGRISLEILKLQSKSEE